MSQLESARNTMKAKTPNVRERMKKGFCRGDQFPSPHFSIPMPKGAPPPRVPMVSQDDDMTTSTEDTEPLSDAESKEEEEPQPIRRSPRLSKNKVNFAHAKPAGISQAALTSFIGNSFMQELKDIGERAEELGLEHVANGVAHPVTKETITNYKTLIKDPMMCEIWMEAMAKELGRLAQGWGPTKGTNTIEFMSHEEIARIPKGKVVTYARIVVDFQPQKEDPNRVRITAGGNLIDYPHELTTCTADLTTTKIMWNSTISTEGARYAVSDAKNFYLATPLDDPEYMRILAVLVPEAFIQKYNLRDKVKDGYIYMRIIRGIYGLPQSGRLASQLLKKRLAGHGYHEVPHTPGLFRHEWRPIWFTLVVDEFGIKYIGKRHADHLLNVLKKHYDMETDWDGSLYCGITLKWNYKDKYVDISMPNYVKKNITKYKHDKPRRPQYYPYEPTPRKYGKAAAEATDEEENPAVSESDKKFIQ